MSNNLTKQEIARSLATTYGFTEKEGETLCDFFLSEIAVALRDGRRVEFRNFGSWSVRLGKARVGFNPGNTSSGPIPIPSRPVIRFKPSKQLKGIIQHEHSNRHSDL